MEHLDELRAEQTAYLASEPITLSSHFEPDTGWWLFTATCPRISLRYSNIVGDCVNNLRSVLDHLVSQLVIANGAQPGRRHQFPITENPIDFATAARPMVAKVSTAHRAIIEAAQPDRFGGLLAMPTLSYHSRSRKTTGERRMDGTERRWVLVEQMAADMQAIKEQVGLIPEIRDDVAEVKANVADLKSRMIVVENVVTEHSKDLKELKSSARKLDIRVSEIGSDVQTIKTRLTPIEGDLKEVKGYVGTHHETLVELKTASHTH